MMPYVLLTGNQTPRSSLKLWLLLLSSFITQKLPKKTASSEFDNAKLSGKERFCDNPGGTMINIRYFHMIEYSWVGFPCFAFGITHLGPKNHRK